jgi:all-trans-retinol 13,14-reductase
LCGHFRTISVAIDGYFKAISRCLRGLPLVYAEKVLPALVAAPLGSSLRAPFMRFARHTTAEVLDDLGVRRELRAVLTAQWGDYGLPPGESSFGVHAIVAAHYFDGGAYPRVEPVDSSDARLRSQLVCLRVGS